MPKSGLLPEQIGKHTIPSKALQNASALPKATYDKLPRWRGFNLLNKFNRGSDTHFSERDFELIHNWGFNFVRLPTDYRTYICGDDWLDINPAVIKQFDQAIEYGAKYGVHINFCLHRIPGFTVAEPKERTSIFDDPQTLEVACRHWAMFAKRWSGIPSQLLSFDLFNEPTVKDTASYVHVVKALTDAIHEQDPDRLVMADGLAYATVPVPELVPLKIAQALHNYQPMGLTHYKASWIPGAGSWPKPQWPSVQIGGFITSKYHPEMHDPLQIDIHALGSAPGSLSMHLREISSEAEFVMKADGKEIFRHHIKCSDGNGEWLKTTFNKEYSSWKGDFDQIYSAEYPAGTASLSIEVVNGDWLRFSEVTVTPQDGGAITVNASAQWGIKPGRLIVSKDGIVRNTLAVNGGRQDGTWLRQTVLKPWVDLAKHSHVGVMIGEWGVFSSVPHDLTLRFMEDSLRAFRQAGLGWALWNLRGDFGIINSNRTDVAYEQLGSDKLDRKMLELLRRY